MIEKEREHFHPLSHFRSGCRSHVWASLKSGSGKPSWSSTLVVRAPPLLSLVHCLSASRVQVKQLGLELTLQYGIPVSQWCLDLLCPTKTDPLKFFFNLLLMRIATRERYLEDGNNTFVCIYHTQREGSFSFSFFFKPSPHSESDYCRTQKKKCSFMAKFILKLKVCKCSKYNKLLIYMSLLTQAQL